MGCVCLTYRMSMSMNLAQTRCNSPKARNDNHCSEAVVTTPPAFIQCCRYSGTDGPGICCTGASKATSATRLFKHISSCQIVYTSCPLDDQISPRCLQPAPHTVGILHACQARIILFTLNLAFLCQHNVRASSDLITLTISHMFEDQSLFVPERCIPPCRSLVDLN